MTEMFGSIATVLAVAGVVLNNRMNIICFYIWIISNLISAGLHFDTGLWTLFVRDIIFTVLAVDGIRRWSKKQ